MPLYKTHKQLWDDLLSCQAELFKDVFLNVFGTSAIHSASGLQLTITFVVDQSINYFFH